MRSELIRIAMVLICHALEVQIISKTGRVVIQVQLNLCDGTYSNTEVGGEIQVNNGIHPVKPQGITSLRIQAYGASGD